MTPIGSRREIERGALVASWNRAGRHVIRVGRNGIMPTLDLPASVGPRSPPRGTDFAPLGRGPSPPVHPNVRDEQLSPPSGRPAAGAGKIAIQISFTIITPHLARGVPSGQAAFRGVPTPRIVPQKNAPGPDLRRRPCSPREPDQGRQQQRWARGGTSGFPTGAVRRRPVPIGCGPGLVSSGRDEAFRSPGELTGEGLPSASSSGPRSGMSARRAPRARVA